MNTIFVVVKNSEFLENQKYNTFLNSIERFCSDTKIIFINSTSKEMNPVSNCEIVNVAPMNSDLNIYGTIIGLINQNKINDEDYILLADIENILFTRNPFSFLKHFNKDLYFYSLNVVSKETQKNRVDYANFVKTCNFFLGNDYESYSIGKHLMAGKCNAFKSLVLTLFLEVNRNSAHFITTQAVLSYTHKHFNNLFNVGMFTNNFCRIAESSNAAESIYSNDEESKKQYVVLNL